MLNLICQLEFIAAIGVKTIQQHGRFPVVYWLIEHHRGVLQQQRQDGLPFSVSMSIKMGIPSGLTDFCVPDRFDILFVINADEVFGGFVSVVNMDSMHV